MTSYLYKLTHEYIVDKNKHDLYFSSSAPLKEIELILVASVFYYEEAVTDEDDMDATDLLNILSLKVDTQQRYLKELGEGKEYYEIDMFWLREIHCGPNSKKLIKDHCSEEIKEYINQLN